MIELGYDVGEMWLHEPRTAIELVSKIGYRVVQLRGRRGVLMPSEEGFCKQWEAIVSLAKQRECDVLIDTNVSFALDPLRRDLPSLSDVPESSAATVDWISDWISAAGQFTSEATNRPVVIFGSGSMVGSDRQVALERLAEAIVPLIELSDRLGVRLAIRPSAGQTIDTVATAEAFQQWLPSDVRLLLAADVAEMMSLGEIPISPRLQRVLERLATVNVPPPSTGSAIGPWSDLAWDRLLTALAGLPWDGPVVVRAPGESIRGVELAQDAWREWDLCREGDATFHR